MEEETDVPFSLQKIRFNETALFWNELDPTELERKGAKLYHSNI